MENGIFDFSVLPSFGHDYLSTYYMKSPTQDEHLVLEFLAEEFPKIGSTKKMLELGCGPTLHHIISASQYVEEIYLADYLEENLIIINNWQKNDSTAHDWTRFIELALKFETKPHSSADIQRRALLMKQKLKGIMKCDLQKDRCMDKEEKFPLVTSFYAAEEVGISQIEWKKVMARISNKIEIGGNLIMASLRDCEEYSVISPNGIHSKLPCAKINESDFNLLLPKLGFEKNGMIVRGMKIHGQENEGVHGIVLVSAKKITN